MPMQRAGAVKMLRLCARNSDETVLKPEWQRGL